MVMMSASPTWRRYSSTRLSVLMVRTCCSFSGSMDPRLSMPSSDRTTRPVWISFHSDVSIAWAVPLRVAGTPIISSSLLLWNGPCSAIAFLMAAGLVIGAAEGSLHS